MCAENFLLYAKWGAQYLTFTSYYDTGSRSYYSCSKRAKGLKAYGSQWWYWYNDTGQDVTVEFSICNEPYKEDGGDSTGCTFYLQVNRDYATGSSTKVFGMAGNGETRQGTFTIPKNTWLFFFNQNNSWTRIDYLNVIY